VEDGAAPAPTDEFNGMMKAWAESGWFLRFEAFWTSHFPRHSFMHLSFIAYLTYIAFNLIIVIVAY
jgi:hypothetical protein